MGKILCALALLCSAALSAQSARVEISGGIAPGLAGGFSVTSGARSIFGPWGGYIAVHGGGSNKLIEGFYGVDYSSISTVQTTRYTSTIITDPKGFGLGLNYTPVNVPRLCFLGGVSLLTSRRYEHTVYYYDFTFTTDETAESIYYDGKKLRPAVDLGLSFCLNNPRKRNWAFGPMLLYNTTGGMQYHLLFSYSATPGG